LPEGLPHRRIVEDADAPDFGPHARFTLTASRDSATGVNAGRSSEMKENRPPRDGARSRRKKGGLDESARDIAQSATALNDNDLLTLRMQFSFPRIALEAKSPTRGPAMERAGAGDIGRAKLPTAAIAIAIALMSSAYAQS
jgi:hypothetical protein